MATLRDLAEWAQSVEEQLPQLLSNVAIDIATAVIEDLTICTPVDQGTALSNWQVTLGQPATEEIPAYSPSEAGVWHGHIWNHKVDPSTTRSANAPLVIENAALTLASKRPGEAIHITNIVGTDKEDESYILELDKGRSPQFIGDFVGRESLIAEQVLQRATLIIK